MNTSQERADTLGFYKPSQAKPMPWVCGHSVEWYRACIRQDGREGAEPGAVLFLKRLPCPSASILTFGFLEQLFCELHHLDHLDPWEAFSHSKDEAVVEGVKQDALPGIPQLIKLLPVQEPPQVLSPLGFLRGILRGKETMSLPGMTRLWGQCQP